MPSKVPLPAAPSRHGAEVPHQVDHSINAIPSQQDIPTPRPSSGHRLSVGSPANGMAGRPSTARPHAHSVSLGGSLNPAHRVSRRKSSTSMVGVNMTALKDSLENGKAANSPALSRSPFATSGGSYMAANAIKDRPTTGSSNTSSALVDGPPLSVIDRSSAKARARRASEGGSRLSKAERRRSTAGELKCETCGKGYKHGSCLTKHLWEHTPEWALTSKLLISKHQQVQLLEAASVLVAMNKDGPEDSAIQNDSDMSGDSPAASGSSDLHEDDAATSSSRTSTPSQDEAAHGRGFKQHPRRQDSYSSAFSRSYQSTAATSLAASSLPADGADMYYRQWQGHSARPSTSSSNKGYYDREDQADVAAAAAGLLSCSLGTPKQHAHLMPDVPPVPALPAKYIGHAQYHRSSASQHGDIEMVEGRLDNIAPQSYSHVRGRSEEDDDGVFGRMEQ
ncbi:hypothetical protein FH972_022666 [Carpinus fangiana]|uniref:C2H2-type domain-containing protein n=1 Tax=Carpinus fangiana TaxID=176857 RepID=A0A5N6KT81_9ROSI|nr:hypothetical protein FH972_022666 [Carpinus fangiana]